MLLNIFFLIRLFKVLKLFRITIQQNEYILTIEKKRLLTNKLIFTSEYFYNCKIDF